MGTACKQSRHNFEKYIRRKCVYCLEQSEWRKHAGCATVKGGHIQKELVSALITSTPINVLLQAKHYHQAVDTLYLCKQLKPLLPRNSETQISEKLDLEGTSGDRVSCISPVPSPAQSRDSINCAKIFLRVSFSQVWITPRKNIVWPLWATCSSASPSAVKMFLFYLVIAYTTTCVHSPCGVSCHL